MPIHIPFQPTTANYRMSVTIEGSAYLFDVHWNSRDAAWYFDILDPDETVIARGIKVVLGALLGRRITHPLLARDGALIARDSTGEGRDAGFNNLGTRVMVAYFPARELAMRVLERHLEAEVL